MPGKMPERKTFGRQEPPKNYPTSPEQYADPLNHMYPLDTAIRTRLARRYFDEPRNRNKYTEEERLFIDSRIDEALKRFEVTADEARISSTGIHARKRPRRPSESQLDKLDLDELLLIFLGPARLERARSIPNDAASISCQGTDVIFGKVKQYLVTIDLKKKVITHDCDDWKRNMRSRLMCKHLGKTFLAIENERATVVLRQMLSETDDWTFNAP